MAGLVAVKVLDPYTYGLDSSLGKGSFVDYCQAMVGYGSYVYVWLNSGKLITGTRIGTEHVFLRIDVTSGATQKYVKAGTATGANTTRAEDLYFAPWQFRVVGDAGYPGSRLWCVGRAFDDTGGRHRIFEVFGVGEDLVSPSGATTTPPGTGDLIQFYEAGSGGSWSTVSGPNYTGSFFYDANGVYVQRAWILDRFVPSAREVTLTSAWGGVGLNVLDATRFAGTWYNSASGAARLAVGRMDVTADLPAPVAHVALRGNVADADAGDSVKAWALHDRATRTLVNPTADRDRIDVWTHTLQSDDTFVTKAFPVVTNFRAAKVMAFRGKLYAWGCKTSGGADIDGTYGLYAVVSSAPSVKAQASGKDYLLTSVSGNRDYLLTSA